MRLLLFIILLFLAGCQTVPPRADGEIAIRPGKPLKVWRIGDGFAPDVKVVYIAADRQEKLLFDGLDYPVKPREQRSESAQFGDWQVSYAVAARTDTFGQEHIMEYTVNVRCGDYTSQRARKIEYNPAYTPPYPVSEPTPAPPVAEPEPSAGGIKWHGRILPGSGGRVLEITGEVTSGARITELTSIRSGGEVRLRVKRGGAADSGSRKISHIISWSDGCQLILDDSGEKIFPLP